MQKHNLTVKLTDDWLDFGHVSGLVSSRLKLFNARDFNNMNVDPQRGVIAKTSTKKQKLKDEADWYNNLPNDLKVLAPRVVKTSETEDDFTLEMELFGYSNLAESFVYSGNNTEDWMYIFDNLFQVHKLLEEHKIPADKDELTEIYYTKTIDRLNDYSKIEGFDKLTADDYININGKKLENLNLIKDRVLEKCKSLAEYSGSFGVTHGDYCFSNILFDPMHYIFRLIDPRGRFKQATIYGDPRYDIAKLRHSAVGLYDFIVLGFYNLEIEDGSYDLKILSSKEHGLLNNFFNKLTVENGFDLDEIKFIEALLFLTMIPLHGDDVNRQTVFYLTAITKLNEVLNND